MLTPPHFSRPTLSGFRPSYMTKISALLSVSLTSELFNTYANTKMGQKSILLNLVK